MEVGLPRAASRGATRRTGAACTAIIVAAAALATSTFFASQAAAQAPIEAGEPPTVLFMCPHGAAKSVLASAYFQRRARERGLNVRVQSAGTEPDATVSPAVAAHLEAQGYSVPTASPRRATAKDVASADVVISIGCDLSGLPQPRGTLVRWDDVPSPGKDFAGADEAIRKRVTDLVDELVQAAGSKPRRIPPR